MEEIVIVAAKRTPFGTFGGTLKSWSSTDLGVAASKAALAQSGLQPIDIDHVIFGNVIQSNVDSIYTPRHIGLKCGIPVPVPALGLNRLCGSGFQAVVTAAQQILAGESTAILAGGTESMSTVPYVVRNARFGYRMGPGEFEDYLTAALVDSYTGTPMAITAENLAVEYKITRNDVDEYSALSQSRCKSAQQAGAFDSEISPVEIKDKKGTTVFSKDEHPRPETTIESLAKLKPVFKADGIVTAGGASGITDGAAALVVTSAKNAAKKNLKPLARLVSYASSGCEPKMMGIGPAPAARKALEKASMKLKDMQLIEINEAFAAQYLAVERELELDRKITNVNGGAIAIGHPLAASGARITMHLIYELRKRKQKYGLGAACIGGGQGIAVVLEVFP
ncbi:MAG: acetyl-CoA C-acetyltransferase [Oligoflexia bacterium]|nr:acetyl-CoA C-acetyltransferase [Oligoflexia bacterium]